MRHISIPKNNQVEIINVSSINPLISKCQIKVCYTGENRNGTVISKDVATTIANSLPGSPIVGFFNEEKADFEEHNRIIDITHGFDLKELTKAYGFVDPSAKIWFQIFIDDNEVEREYLLTEGYLWTGQYPEAQKIMQSGKGQSMELDQETLKGNWAEDENTGREFFIINEAIISKLCILGDDVEPCFEGANITPTAQFSLNDNFFDSFKLMMSEFKELINQGGDKKMTEEEKKAAADKKAAEDKAIADQKAIDDKAAADKKAADEKAIADKKAADDKAAADKAKGKYNLEEVTEYTELLDKFNQLQVDYNQLVIDKEVLSEFKLKIEDEQKKEMVKTEFAVLSDEDKKDVVDHLSEYSLEEIKSKLAVICVDKKVNFNLNDPEENGTHGSTYNLDDDLNNNSSVPAWIKAVKKNKEK